MSRQETLKHRDRPALEGLGQNCVVGVRTCVHCYLPRLHPRIHRDLQADRQTVGHAGRQTDMQAGRQRDMQKDTRICAIKNANDRYYSSSSVFCHMADPWQPNFLIPPILGPSLQVSTPFLLKQITNHTLARFLPCSLLPSIYPFVTAGLSSSPLIIFKNNK